MKPSLLLLYCFRKVFCGNGSNGGDIDRVYDNPQLSPLHEAHLKLKARTAEFAGWEMPIQYEGIIPEHHAVREKWGVFDISHMGLFSVTGETATAELNGILTNDVSRLEPGQGQYTLMLNENGGVIDDLIVYRTAPDAFTLVVNAALADTDRKWIETHLTDAKLDDRSANYGGIAVQGPASVTATEAFLPMEAPPRNGITERPDVILCRTGYTGEDGFELFAPVDSIMKWWDSFLAAGATPCGLGARDTLRLEMCYPLNGSDLTPTRTPLEAGLGFFVAMGKGDFIGRKTLATQKKNGVKEKLAAFVMTEKGPPPRAHYDLYSGADKIGETTSGCLSPSLGKGAGMAYVPAKLSRPGTELELEIRNCRFPVQIHKKPLYRKP